MHKLTTTVFGCCRSSRCFGLLKCNMDADQGASPANEQAMTMEEHYKRYCTPATAAWNKARLATDDNRLDWDEWWDTNKHKYNDKMVTGDGGGCLSEATVPQ